MQMWGRAALYIAMVCCTSAVAASEGHICWVDHVEMEGKEGVRIFYTPSFPWKNSDFDKGAYLKFGEQAFVSLASHDMCVLKAVRKDDKLGVEARFSFAMVQPQPLKLNILPLKDLPFPYIAPPPPPQDSEYFTRVKNEWIEAFPKGERSIQSE